jgi:hypothetical protein
MKLECAIKSLKSDFTWIAKILLSLFIASGILYLIYCLAIPINKSFIVLLVPIGFLLVVDNILIYLSLLSLPEDKIETVSYILIIITIIALITTAISMGITSYTDLDIGLTINIIIINIISMVFAIPLIRAYCKCKE